MFDGKLRHTCLGTILRASAVAGALALSASVAMAQGAGGAGGAGGGGAGGAEQTPAGSPGAKKGPGPAGEKNMMTTKKKKKKKSGM